MDVCSFLVTNTQDQLRSVGTEVNEYKFRIDVPSSELREILFPLA